MYIVARTVDLAGFMSEKSTVAHVSPASESGTSRDHELGVGSPARAAVRCPSAFEAAQGVAAYRHARDSMSCFLMFPIVATCDEPVGMDLVFHGALESAYRPATSSS